MADRYEQLTVDQLHVDLGTQTRATSDPDHTKRIISGQNEGSQRPEDDPVVAFWDGKRFILASGFYWVEAMRTRQGGKAKLRVLVKDGNEEDAIAWAAEFTNLSHGLPLSSKDKRHKVHLLLKTKKYGSLPTSELAQKCHVSMDLVKSVRDAMPEQREQARKRKDGKPLPARKPKEAANGAAFDWRAYMAVYGGLMRQVDVAGKMFGYKESVEAKGLRRLLHEWHGRFKKLYKARSKLNPPEE